MMTKVKKNIMNTIMSISKMMNGKSSFYIVKGDTVITIILKKP